MACPLCGDICRCPTDANSVASPRWLPDRDSLPAASDLSAALEITQEETQHQQPEATTLTPEDSVESATEDSPGWRQELAARLNRYQARRKPRAPRYPSLRLRFEDEDSARDQNEFAAPTPPFPHESVPLSHQGLALDTFSASGAIVAETFLPADQEAAFRQTATLPAEEYSQLAVAPASAKIIEFPRSWTPPPAPLDELAEPVTDCPRILEAPEFIPPPPALGGITIEPPQRPEAEKRPGIDIPLQSAPLARRILSAAIDDIIIAAACSLFAFIFWKMTAIRPPRFQLAGLAGGLSVLFWAVYQYLLVVYAGTTPGLRVARLELACFDGSPAGRGLRRWRVLASFLSALSLGMGYAWVFLDEDSLCWHDRITHTYLAPKMR